MCAIDREVLSSDELFMDLDVPLDNRQHIKLLL